MTIGIQPFRISPPHVRLTQCEVLRGASVVYC